MKARRYLSVFIILLLMPSLVLISAAHPGKTDGNGGHTNHENGDYHYHHGYPAHNHYDMDGDGIADCPYDFVDKTGQNSGSSQSSRPNATTARPNATTSPQTTFPPSQENDHLSWWEKSINEKTFILSFFVYGISALLIAIAFHFLSNLCEKHHFSALSKVTNIVSIIVGIISTPCAIIVLFVAYVVWLFSLLTGVVLNKPLKSLKKLLSCIRTENSNRISITRATASQTLPSPYKEATLSSAPSPHQPIYPTNTPASRRVCYMIWSETSIFNNFLTTPMDVIQFMQMWSIYFFVVAKSVNNQNFVNEVYSHFDVLAAQYVTKFCSPTSVMEMKSEYRKMRPHLNPIKIDPTDTRGNDFLWNLVSQRVFFDAELPPSAKEQFYTGVKVLSRFSRHSYSADSTHIKYSIDEFAPSDLLPDK